MLGGELNQRVTTTNYCLEVTYLEQRTTTIKSWGCVLKERIGTARSV